MGVSCWKGSTRKTCMSDTKQAGWLQKGFRTPHVKVTSKAKDKGFGILKSYANEKEEEQQREPLG